MAGSGKVAARTRAREAAAAMLAKRRKRDQQIEAAARTYYEVDAALAVARDAVAAAEAERLDALAAVIELGLTNSEVTELCAAEVTDVRIARRQLKAAKTRPADTAEAGTDGDGGDETKSDAGDEDNSDAGDEDNSDAGDKDNSDTGDKDNSDTGDEDNSDTGDETNSDTGDEARAAMDAEHAVA